MIPGLGIWLCRKQENAQRMTETRGKNTEDNTNSMLLLTRMEQCEHHVRYRNDSYFKKKKKKIHVCTGTKTKNINSKTSSTNVGAIHILQNNMKVLFKG